MEQALGDYPLAQLYHWRATRFPSRQAEGERAQIREAVKQDLSSARYVVREEDYADLL